ncbi:MAG: Hsp20/alpha crystallin family protein [Nanoarchaeota archaeon]|nr:Hsp20/alpha crystallin family protein [Nanoarchaeota archaeon]
MTKKKKKEEPKIAEAVLEGIGGIIPGLSKMFKEAVKTEPIKTRLKEVNKEIQDKLKGRPLRKSDIKVEGGWKVSPIISEKKPTVVEEIKPVKPVEKKVLTDVFDEKDKIIVITQLGIPSKDIRLKAEGKVLKIYEKNKVVESIRLPSPVEYVIKKNYKNGILTVELKK